MEKVREVAVPNLVVVFLLLFPALWFDYCSVQCPFKRFQAAQFVMSCVVAVEMSLQRKT